MYYQIFTVAFVVVAMVYSILAASTKIFYKGKSVSKLSQVERDILYDRAKFTTRIGIFFMNLVGSFIAPPVWIIAGLITLIVYLTDLVI